MLRIGCLIQHDSVAALVFALFFLFFLRLFCFLPASHLEEVSPQEEKQLNVFLLQIKPKTCPTRRERGALSSKSQDSFGIFEHLFILTLYFSHCFQFSSISSAMISFLLLFFCNRLLFRPSSEILGPINHRAGGKSAGIVWEVTSISANG